MMAKSGVKTPGVEAVGEAHLATVTGGRVVDGVREFLFPAGTGGLDLAAKTKEQKNQDSIGQIDLWVGGISE